MNMMKHYTLIFIGIFISVASCAALFFSYSAYVASNRAEKNFKQSLGELAQDLSSLKTQLAAVKDRAEDNSAHRYSMTGKAVPDRGPRETAVKERSAINRLEKIVESTGLEKLVENQNNESFSHIVTERGVEAIPNVEYYLARQYLRQGDNDSALALIESLEKNYPDSLLFTGRRGSGRRWQPVSQVVTNLRRQVE